MRISIITPTFPSEHCRLATIRSCLEKQMAPGDEWLVCTDDHPEAAAMVDGAPGLVYLEGPRTRMNGNAQREMAMRRATGDVLWFVDDTVLPMPNAMEVIRQFAVEPRPYLFRVLFVPYPDLLKWKVKEWHLGSHDVVAAGIVTPNHQDRLGSWHLADDVGDRSSPYGYKAPKGHEWTRAGGYFVDSTIRNYPEGPIWRPEFVSVWFE